MALIEQEGCVCVCVKCRTFWHASILGFWQEEGVCCTGQLPLHCKKRQKWSFDSFSMSLALPMIESTWHITVVLLQRRGHNCISTLRKRKHYFNWHFSPALELWQDTEEIPVGMAMRDCEELQKWQNVHNNQSNQVGFIKRPRNKTKSAWNSPAKSCASSQIFQGIIWIHGKNLY